MAESEEDTPARSDAASSSESGSESEEEQVEWLATTREKRSTAGNRLSALLQQEEPDDELELLFQEDEDDEGFEDEEGDQSDVQMDSSSDEEDQGPTAGADDLEGEKELERENREERQAKKRKLQDGIPKIFRKRVKIDPTAAEAPASRPKKKSERVSWIPAAGDMPTRASARGTTKKSKEQLHAQMVHREIKRLKQLANMEKAQAAKEAAKKPPMTQADRLREAAQVEKQNAKSLNRWEEAEQRREEEQRAKLEALNNRQLEGPVITWWSGLAEWAGGKLKKVGKTLTIDAPKEKAQPKKRKAAEMEGDSQSEPMTEQLPNGNSATKDSVGKASAASADNSNKPTNDETPIVGQEDTEDKAVAETKDDRSVTDDKANDESTSNPIPRQVPEQEKTEDDQTRQREPHPQLTSNLPSAVPLPPPTPELPPPKDPTNPPFILAPPPGFNYTPYPYPSLQPPNIPNISMPYQFPPSQLTPFHSQPPEPPGPPPPPVIEHTAINYLILSNFDENAIKSKDAQTQILFNRKFPKAHKQKPAESCVITAYPAKYRDPSTNLPYYNAYAYREIQKLKRSEFKWSKFLGAYVGMGTYAARGVPPRFLNPNAPGPAKEPSSEKVEDTGSSANGKEDQAPKSTPESSKTATENGVATPIEGS
ncbi:YL1 nuclear protein-domain-containing protein [Xylogone sp. PMI_703]|nr:YL1 nuclear protein-domain-containing protein [Xylogone sp. PMI_703]